MDYNSNGNQLDEIVSSVRKSIVKTLSQKVRGYIYITFTEDETLVVSLLDTNNNVLHEEREPEIFYKIQDGFSVPAFCEDFTKNLKRKILKKYFK